jgi:septum formation protein
LLVDLRPPFPADFRLFLASQSPRRHSLLKDMGVPYEVVRTTAEEVTEGDTATALAAANAAAKVRFACLPPGPLGRSFVLGTDTLVTVDGVVMGKPTSRLEAAGMITALSGRAHQVVSGVALLRLDGNGEAQTRDPRIATATTDVTFLQLDEAQIEAYLDSGEWTDKAGAYGIQGLAGLFAAEVRGEYSNVVGLPLCRLAALFRDHGFDLLRRQWI